jgi:putative phosphonate metabolism protein
VRYAVYFAPEAGSAWGRFGAQWLGRDAATGREVEQRAIAGIDAAAFRALTETPRRYGFHATLKAPFVLRDGAAPAALADAIARFCAVRQPFQVPPLELVRLDDFLALAPAAHETRISDLAADCVRELDGFRAPASTAELERRRRRGLSTRQDRYLAEWGYPYVLADFRFHFTLTGSLDGAAPQEVAAVRAAAHDALARLADEPLRFDAVCLFEQPGPSLAFRLAARFPLGRAAAARRG